MPRQRAAGNPFGQLEVGSSSQSASTAAPAAAAQSAIEKRAYEGVKLTYVTPRLNKNFVDWAPKAEDIQGVWSIVKGTEIEPNEKASLAVIQDWRRRNAIGLAVLSGSGRLGQSRENIDCGESNPTAPEHHTQTCIPECTPPFCGGSPLWVHILEFGIGSWRLERSGRKELGAGRSLRPGGAFWDWGKLEAGRSLRPGGA